LFYQASATNGLTPEFILQDAARCLYHSLTETDLRNVPATDRDKFVWFADYIPRFSTSASVVIQGITKNESSSIMTMWTVLGFPLCSVVYPVWFNDEHLLPLMLSGEKGTNAPLCDKALKLKDLCFPVKRGHGEDYLNLTALVNNNENGILQKLDTFEDQEFANIKPLLTRWKTTPPSPGEVRKFYANYDDKIRTLYSGSFE
jgi:hypothetical protein